jgi:hypothetical protein
MFYFLKRLLPLTLICIALNACTVAKLEARLEADPQCKPVINPKTGSLMPCPGSDKAFYASVGLVPAKSEGNTPSGVAVPSSAVGSSIPTPPMSNKPPANPTNNSGCKPKLHKKTGGVLPCPAY